MKAHGVTLAVVLVVLGCKDRSDIDRARAASEVKKLWRSTSATEAEKRDAETARMKALTPESRAAEWIGAMRTAMDNQSMDQVRARYEGSAPPEDLRSSAMVDAKKKHEAELKRMARVAADDVRRRAKDGVQAQRNFAEIYETQLLRDGIECSVRADGTTLRVKSVLCGGVLVQRLYDRDRALLSGMGFTKLICSGYSETTSMGL